MSPGVQAVPTATCMRADQVPLAHCWKYVPPMQFHSPSVVHGPVRAADAVPAGGATDVGLVGMTVKVVVWIGVGA